MKALRARACAALLVAHAAHAFAQDEADIIARANDAARASPNAENFEAARVVYSYTPGALYALHANPLYVSLILLEPGERVNAIAAGDTSRWSVTEAETQSDQSPRPLIMVKPQTANLRTNIAIVTDRRTYLVEARANAGRTYMAELAWSYPQEARIAPAPAALNFGYRIRTLRGRAPAWVPAIVFDNGAQTFIEFAEGVAATDMAPLFVITPEGAELTNYRVEGRRYIVDRLFEAAELRLGVRAPVIVRIERGPPHERPRPRRGGRP